MNIGGRVVVLGGYGNFGRRICRALARDSRAEIIVAGRNLQKASCLTETLAAEFPNSRLSSLELDISDSKFVRRLGSVAPIVVVHTAGPFQAQNYDVAEACIACRSHYIDLADGRSFVSGFGELDREARRRDVLLLTGASTLPGVSTAVVDHLSRDLDKIHLIRSAIIPAHQSQPGYATIAGVMNYCGRAVRTLVNGQWVDRLGWYDGRDVSIDGVTRPVAACDVPDLELLPRHYDGVRNVSFDAGAELRTQHQLIRLMAKLTQNGIVSNWARHARALCRANAFTRFLGSATGYMQVEVEGFDQQANLHRRKWTMIAANNHGPEIPCVTARVIVRKLLSGELSDRGAQPCLSMITLDDFDRETADLDISWHTSDELVGNCSAS